MKRESVGLRHVTVPNFVKIGPPIAKILQFFKIPAAILNFQNCYWLTGSRGLRHFYFYFTLVIWCMLATKNNCPLPYYTVYTVKHITLSTKIKFKIMRLKMTFKNCSVWNAANGNWEWVPTIRNSHRNTCSPSLVKVDGIAMARWCSSSLNNVTDVARTVMDSSRMHQQTQPVIDP